MLASCSQRPQGRRLCVLTCRPCRHYLTRARAHASGALADLKRADDARADRASPATAAPDASAQRNRAAITHFIAPQRCVLAGGLVCADDARNLGASTSRTGLIVSSTGFLWSQQCQSRYFAIWGQTMACRNHEARKLLMVQCASIRVIKRMHDSVGIREKEKTSGRSISACAGRAPAIAGAKRSVASMPGGRSSACGRKRDWGMQAIKGAVTRYKAPQARAQRVGHSTSCVGSDGGRRGKVAGASNTVYDR